MAAILLFLSLSSRVPLAELAAAEDLALDGTLLLMEMSGSRLSYSVSHSEVVSRRSRRSEVRDSAAVPASLSASGSRLL